MNNATPPAESANKPRETGDSVVTAPLTLPGIMWRTNAALLPGLLVACIYFGVGYLSNLVIACGVGLALEASWLRLRNQDVARALGDGTAVLSCALIALACPPATSPLVLGVAVTVAIILAKHLYGGLGRNLFNPAMTGYAFALVSFPAAFTNWPVPIDGITQATALDSLKTLSGETLANRWTLENGFGAWGGYGTEWMALAFSIGGAYLWWREIIAWRVSVGFVAVLALCAGLGYDNGSSVSGGSANLHLLSGGTLLAAWFVLTDPVTHPANPRAQWAFGALCAICVYLIRRYGAYPDGIAFAVLLANSANPLLDRLLPPHPSKTRGNTQAEVEEP